MERTKEPLANAGTPEGQIQSGGSSRTPARQMGVQTGLSHEKELGKAGKETRKSGRRRWLRRRHRRQLVIWWTRIIFLWVALAGFGYYAASRGPKLDNLPDVGDLATIFFGTSSLALLIVSLVLAIAAIIGWSYIKESLAKEIKSSEEARHELRNDIASNKDFMEYLNSRMDARLKSVQEQTSKLAEEERAKAIDLERELHDSGVKAEEYMQAQITSIRGEVKDRFGKVEKEIQGRIKLTTGYTLASSVMNRIELKASELVKGSPVASDLDRTTIKEAIHILETSCQDFKEAETLGHYPALNNIIYYSCVLRLDEKREELLSQAKELQAIAKEYRDRKSSIPYFMTFCWTLLLYGTGAGEMYEALRIGEELMARKDTTSAQREEATDIVASLKYRLSQLLASNSAS